MIVVDTSAVVTLFTRESEWRDVAKCLGGSNIAWFPVPAYLEFTLRKKLGPTARGWLDDLLRIGPLRLAPLEVEHAALAADAALRYGKGSGHRAQLNFGDCFSYAVAKQRGLPLLYVGRDFTHTDIQPALEP